MIPKKIHYCWFGRAEKPKLVKKCIESWQMYCPDYEIIEWNEDNFDVSINDYTKMCYENGKWAFLSDYARLLIIYENGGIYFDTDVEVIKSVDPLLQHGAFFGFENNEFVATGLGFGAEKGHTVIKKMLEEYHPLMDGMSGVEMCPKLNTQALSKMGLEKNGCYQVLADNTIIYPIDFFNPLDDATGVLNITDNTYSINHYGKTWMDKKTIFRSKLTRPFHRVFGMDCFSFLKGK